MPAAREVICKSDGGGGGALQLRNTQETRTTDEDERKQKTSIWTISIRFVGRQGGRNGGGGAEFKLDRRKLSSLEDMLGKKCGPPSDGRTDCRTAHLTSVKCPRVLPPSLPESRRRPCPAASTSAAAATTAAAAEMPFCKRRPISDYEYSTRILACIPPPPSSIRLFPPRLHLSSSSRDGRRRRRRIKSPNRSLLLGVQ